MNLYLKCPNCKHEHSFRSNKATRVDYAMENGKIKELECNLCELKTNIQINKIYAKESKVAYLIAGIIFLMGIAIVIMLWSKFLINSNSSMALYAIGLLLIVPVWVYVIIHKEELMRIRTFNSNFVKEEF